MAYSPAALFHGRRGQTGGADEVADTVNIGNGRLAMFVDVQRSLFSDDQASRAEVEVLKIGLSPQGHEHFIACEYLPVLECRDDLRDSIPLDVFDGLFSTVEAASVLKALHKHANEFRIEKLKGTISPIDDSDLYAERGKD